MPEGTSTDRLLLQDRNPVLLSGFPDLGWKSVHTHCGRPPMELAPVPEPLPQTLASPGEED